MIDYKQLAAMLRAGEFDSDTYFKDTLKQYNYVGKVVPKGRPRFTKGGKVFTPPETRKFETDVREWGYDCGMKPVAYPIRAWLTIYDKSVLEGRLYLATHDLEYDMHGDLDNYQKAVFDALNGVAYKDDKQLVEVHVRRKLHREEGFYLTMERAGLTALEAGNLKKFL